MSTQSAGTAGAGAVPPVRASLTWDKELIFHCRTPKGYEVDYDSKADWGCTPVETLLLSLAGCMAIDVVSILQKMRCGLTRFEMEIDGDRNQVPPKRFTTIRMIMTLAGESVTPQQVERAISLSRETYCSVYHTLRPDLEISTEYRILEAGA